VEEGGELHSQFLGELGLPSIKASMMAVLRDAIKDTLCHISLLHLLGQTPESTFLLLYSVQCGVYEVQYFIMCFLTLYFVSR
jgi:hypothetical protein